VKWKVATASVVTAAMLSAPVAGAAPGNNNNISPNEVGQAISGIASIAGGGATPGVWLETLNGLGGLLGKLGFGKKNQGSGNGAELQKKTLDNIGKTLQKPVTP